MIPLQNRVADLLMAFDYRHLEKPEGERSQLVEQLSFTQSFRDLGLSYLLLYLPPELSLSAWEVPGHHLANARLMAEWKSERKVLN